MVQFKLTYFNFMGRAETARMLFALAGVSYSDTRIDVQEWAEFKPKTPFGTLPILEMDDGKMLTQSHAINRFLAKEFGYAGTNEYESARADMFAQAMEDLIPQFVPWHKEQDPDKKRELYKAAVDNHQKPLFSSLEKFLAENGTGFFVGKSLTWADLYLFHQFSFFAKQDAQVLVDFPEIKKFIPRIENIPAIKAWIGARPVTSR